jgi:hypothetical protein
MDLNAPIPKSRKPIKQQKFLTPFSYDTDIC